MIKIDLYSDSLGDIRRYHVKGHADFAEYGEDIVCAAISVLAQTTLIGLVEVLNLKENEIFYKIDENTGYLNVELKDIKDENDLKSSQLLLETFKLGIQSIQESYPGNIKIEYRRCS